MPTKQNQTKKPPNEGEKSLFLKSTPYMVCNTFLEKYCIAGVLTILPIFLHDKLGLDENYGTAFYHIFSGGIQVFAVLGTVIAETWVGLFNSIVISSIMSAAALALISVAVVEPLNLPIGALVTIGLVVVMVANGVFKNNLNAFGGGQHKLPEQRQQLEIYFSAQCFFLDFGIFLTRIISPIIRADVKCLGSDNCYSLAFGISAFMMLLVIFVFLCGSSRYVELKPNGNMLLKVGMCIKNALAVRRQAKKCDEKRHWLEYSEEKYGKKLVMETKIALKVVLMSLTVPVFFACINQHESRWIFQATKLDGDLGFYTIKPDQMVVIDSLMAVLMIPLLDKFIYNWLAKVGIKSTLQRLIFGGVLNIVAFILAIILETQIQHQNLSILWQFPQFIVIGVAETFVFLSFMIFAYTEAPSSMKPVMMSLLYLSMAGGDLIVAVVSSAAIFSSQAYEYAFYVCLALVNVIVLSVLACKYQSTDHEELKSLED